MRPSPTNLDAGGNLHTCDPALMCLCLLSKARHGMRLRELDQGHGRNFFVRERRKVGRPGKGLHAEAGALSAAPTTRG
jgi:hypothetical protein